MKALLTFGFAALAAPAAAHPGHLVDLAGHNHWLAAAAIAAAAAAALWQATQGKASDDEAEEADVEIAAEPQEA